MVPQIRRCSAWLFVLLAVGPAGAAKRVDDEVQTTWRQLTWEDFQGPIRRGQQAAGVDTNMMIELRKTDVEEISPGRWVARPLALSVYAVTNKLLSSALQGDETDHVLAHEQIHFDITEVLARRLNEELQAVEAEGASRAEAQAALVQVVQRAHKATMEELGKMQADYDRESGHGTRKKGQKRWADEVAAMLAAEPPYPLL